MRIFFTLIILSVQLYSADTFENTIKFASKEAGQKLLLTEDDYTKGWSEFDVNARMGKASTKEDLIKFGSDQVLKWTNEDKTKISTFLKEMDENVKELGLTIQLPDSIQFVKTTCAEESEAAGYTRLNYVVLNDTISYLDDFMLKRLVAHEIFHVISRSFPELRKQLYSIIGFNVVDEIEIPEKVHNFMISNPDATQMDNYIELEVEDKTVKCMMILFTSKPYAGGNMFSYLNVGFLEIDDNNKVKMVEGKYNLYDFREVKGFIEKVGRNTQYIIHPEEILAENFANMIFKSDYVPDQWILEKMRAKFK